MEFYVHARAPAKLNLHLEIFGRRPDGFHDLSSLFLAVDLCDDISIRSLTDTKSIEVSGDFDCLPEKTTIYRASELFFLESGEQQGLDIQVVKRIPAGAGLGGGSSDAACVLKALNRATGARIPQSTLHKIASEIGSDVPFFLMDQGAAIAEGRGEILRTIAPRTDFAVVVVFPGFSVNTAWAYRQLDIRGVSADRSRALARDHIEAMYLRQPSEWEFSNTFQTIVDSIHPPNARIRAALRESGASFSAMSGSGSSVFGIFPTMHSASAAASSLQDAIVEVLGADADPRCARVEICRPLASMHDLAYH